MAPPAARKNDDDNGDTLPIFGLDFIQSMQLPSLFPKGGAWFCSKTPGSIKGPTLHCQIGSVIFDSNKKHHMKSSIAPSKQESDEWIQATIQGIDEANTDLVLSGNGGPPSSIEKFKYLGQNDITRLLTVAQVPTGNGGVSPPFLLCVGLPTVPRGGLIIASNELWSPASETDATKKLLPGNIDGPAPFSQALFVTGTVANIRGKKDSDDQPINRPYAILKDGALISWDAGLHASVVIPVPNDQSLLPRSHLNDDTWKAIQTTYAATRVHALARGDLTDQIGNLRDPNHGDLLNLHFSPKLSGSEDDIPCYVLPRYIVFTGPGVLPLGILGSPALGPDRLQGALSQQLNRDAHLPLQALTESPLMRTWLQAVAAHMEDFITTWTPFNEICDTIVIKDGYVNSLARDTLFCSLQSAAWRVHRDCQRYSMTSRMYDTFEAYETITQGCFDNSDKEYYHDVPASMNGSLVVCRPIGIKQLYAPNHLNIKAFLESPFLDDCGCSFDILQINKEQITKGSLDGAWHLRTIDETQVVIDGFESEDQMSPPGKQQRFMEQYTKQQAKRQRAAITVDSPLVDNHAQQQSQTINKTLFSSTNNNIINDPNANSKHVQFAPTPDINNNQATTPPPHFPPPPLNGHHSAPPPPPGQGPPSTNHQQQFQQQTNAPPPPPGQQGPPSTNHQQQFQQQANASYAPHQQSQSFAPPGQASTFPPFAAANHSAPAPPPNQYSTQSYSQPQGPPLAASIPNTQSPRPSFDLNNDSMYEASAAYWFMALLAKSDPSVTAQEVNAQTGATAAHYMDQTTILIPATLNDAFKESMLVPPLAGTFAAAQSKSRISTQEQARIDWWRTRAHNALQLQNGPRSGFVPMMTITSPSPISEFDELNECPRFVESFRAGPQTLRPETMTTPNAHWFNAFSFLIFLPGGYHTQDKKPVFPRQGISGDNMIRLLGTIIWCFWTLIKPDSATNINQPIQDPLQVMRQIPFLNSLLFLQQTCLAFIQPSVYYHSSTWPTDALLQCNMACAILQEVNRLLDLFKCLIAPTHRENTLIRPLWALESRFRAYIRLVNPSFDPYFTQQGIQISFNNTIHAAIHTWTETVRNRFTMPHASSFPPISDAWLSPNVRTHSLPPQITHQQQQPSGIKQQEQSKYNPSKQQQDSDAPTHPPLKTKKPLLKWKVPSGERRKIGKIMAKAGVNKPKFPNPDDPSKPKYFCFSFLLEGMHCRNQHHKNKSEACKFLHIDSDSPLATKESLASLSASLKKAPLSNFFTWSEHGQQFAST